MKAWKRKILRGDGNDGENNQACNDRGLGETVDSESNLARLLDEADEHTVVLVKGNKRYRLERDHTGLPALPEQPGAGHVHTVLDAVAGSWVDIDADALLDDIYEARSNDVDRPRFGAIWGASSRAAAAREPHPEL